MSRNYYHARWNDQDWKDDGHCLRRAAVPFGDVQIGAHISYYPHETRAIGSIDYSVDLHFGGYNLYGSSSNYLREFHGPKCVPAMKEYINRFMVDQYALICRWYFDGVYYLIKRDTDPDDYSFKKNLNPEDLDRAWDHLEAIRQNVIAVEKGTAPAPAPVKRAGQMALSLGA